MLFKTRSGAVYGIDASPVEVEVNITSGGNGEFRIVGLPDAAIRESRARIDAAIRTSGFEAPFQRITVNLAPAGLRKEGPSFDLPMAVGILGTLGVVGGDLSDVLMIGELSLDGRLRPVRGALSLALLARKIGVRQLVVPAGNAQEAALEEGVEVYGARSLGEAVAFFNGARELAPCRLDPQRVLAAGSQASEDFQDVRGQQHAKRAIEVAVAGGHNILMTGPPGSGKTMLARRIPSIMPPMTLEESLETTRIHSTGGLLPEGAALVGRRPFRAPHHTISHAGLVGGGSIPRPGEVSLAHNGVLFLDELPEFPRYVLEMLRQPLEESTVTIARSQMTLSYPASIVLAAAMNPCRCGYHGDPRHACACTPKQIQAYLAKLSGPLMDRIDIHVDVPAVSYAELADGSPAEPSAAIRARVIEARRAQLERFKGQSVYTNAKMPASCLRNHCSLSGECERLLERAIARFGISARGWNRILKVARTIADLERADRIGPAHIAEAIRYRKLERVEPNSGTES